MNLGDITEHDAVFRHQQSDYPELKNATIIITDEGDNACVGVKAIGLVVERADDGGFIAHENQFGDYCLVSKNEPISKLFDSIKVMFEGVSKLIKETSNIK